MASNLNNRIEQAKRLLFSFSVYNSYFPVLAFIGNSFIILGTIGIKFYIEVNNIKLTDNQYNNYLKYEWINEHFFQTSGLFLFWMLINSKGYKFISWISLLSLISLWILNFIYVSFDLLQDCYYSVYVIIIYFIFVILTVRKLTNRK